METRRKFSGGDVQLMQPSSLLFWQRTNSVLLLFSFVSVTIVFYVSVHSDKTNSVWVTEESKGMRCSGWEQRSDWNLVWFLTAVMPGGASYPWSPIMLFYRKHRRRAQSIKSEVQIANPYKYSDERDNETNISLLKELGFTMTTVGDEDRPVCFR